MFKLTGVKYKSYLDIPELVIRERRITTLVGPSGSGKTTLLKLLNKLIPPTSGRILFQGRDLAHLDSIEHRRQVVMLSQDPVVFAGTVRDNLNAGLLFRQQPPEDDVALNSLLAQVKLDKPLDAPTDKQSGGEKQRLTLARVMLLAPDVYLLDEPSSSLDEATADFVHQMLVRRVKAANRTMVIVTHARAVADKYSDAVIRFTPGGVIDRVEEL